MPARHSVATSHCIEHGNTNANDIAHPAINHLVEQHSRRRNTLPWLEFILLGLRLSKPTNEYDDRLPDAVA